MAYNTKAIKLDVGSKPIPQYYNSGVDDYEVLQGQNGAARALLYGADGTPLLTSTNPGYVRAADGMIAALGALADAASTDPAATASAIALLKGLLTKLANPATEATLAQVKTVLDTINASTDGLEALLTAIRDTAGIKKVVDPVDVADRAARALGKISADDGAIAALGALAAAAVTDPAASASAIALLKGLLKQLQGTGTGAAPVILSGRKVPRVQTVLTTTPLAALATYTQSGVDAEAWTGSGGTSAIVVSGMAKADKPGTLFLDVSHDNLTWITWDAALANSTGVARMRPITIPLRYFRFRYVNGDQAQTNFVVVQNIMQDGDGRGGEHGAGMDMFQRWGSLAAGTTETVVDVRSPVEIVYLEVVTDYNNIYLGLSSYKDDGSAFAVSWDPGNGTLNYYAHPINYIIDENHPWFDVLKNDTTDGRYAVKKRDAVPSIFARGFKLHVINNDSVAHNVSVHCLVRVF